MALTNTEYGEWAISEGIDPYGPHDYPDPTPATSATYSTTCHLAAALDGIRPERIATRHLSRQYGGDDSRLLALATALCPTGERTNALSLIEVVNSALTATAALCEEITIADEGVDLRWNQRLRRQAREHLGNEVVDRLELLGQLLVADAGHGSGYWMTCEHFTSAIIGTAGRGSMPDQLVRDLTDIWRSSVREVACRHLAARRSEREEQAQANPVDPRIDEWAMPA